MGAKVVALACALAVAIPLISLFGTPPADSFVLEFTAAQTVATPVPDVIPNIQYQQVTADGLLSVGPVDIVGVISFQNDGKYAETQPGFWAGLNATLDSGGVSLDLEPSEDNEFYLFQLYATKGPFRIGELKTHGERGYGNDLRFRVK